MAAISPLVAAISPDADLLCRIRSAYSETALLS